MIPYQAALILWIPVSAALMSDRNNARGFSLAYLLALAILPSPDTHGGGWGSIDLPLIPDLRKDNVATIGVLIGTILFHPRLFDRFRLIAPDLLAIAIIQVALITSYVNGFGLYDGMSESFSVLVNLALPIMLARIHLGTMASLKTFLITVTLVGAAVAPFALWEFRMSPQIHTMTYGYFQHVFQQHYRDGFWRPIVYFTHALALGRFFAFAAFLALIPMRRDLERLLGPWGRYLFLAPLAGLAVSQSFGPYLLFGLLCGGYWIVRERPKLLFAFPAIAFLWLVSILMGYQPGYGVVDEVATVNPDRAGTLQYRLDALQEYREVILNRPGFGHGGWGHGRIEGRATDSQALISLLARGAVGTAVYFAWWFIALIMGIGVIQATHGTRFCDRATAVTLLTSLALVVATIDAGLDQHVLLAVSGLVAIHGWLRTHPDIPTLNGAAGLRIPARGAA